MEIKVILATEILGWFEISKFLSQKPKARARKGKSGE